MITMKQYKVMMEQAYSDGVYTGIMAGIVIGFLVCLTGITLMGYV